MSACVTEGISTPSSRHLKLQELLASNRELARRFDELEARLEKRLTEHDKAIAAILSAIRQLMNPPAPKRRGIGFTADIGTEKYPPSLAGGRVMVSAVVVRRSAPPR